VTLRTRSKPVPIGDTSRCTRYTSLTCLICQVLVYRVHQVVPLDVEGKDGPLLPTNEWVEKEVLKSTTGWIEVYRNGLVSAHSSVRFATQSMTLSNLSGAICGCFEPQLVTRQIAGPLTALMGITHGCNTSSYTTCLAEPRCCCVSTILSFILVNVFFAVTS
jgi:hypothetical protein